jgi:hypothetical protein
LCTGVGTAINCTGETIIDFATGVSNLTFDGLGVESAGQVARVEVSVGGAVLTTIDLIGNRQGFNPMPVNLTAFSNVTRVRIFDITDIAGIGWDTFRFEAGATTVSEPATLALFALGFAGLVARQRKMRAAK